MITSSKIINRVEPSQTLGTAMLVNDMAQVLRTISDSKSYYQKPPIGPTDNYPVLSEEELELMKKTAEISSKDATYLSIKLVEDNLAPISVELPSESSLSNVSIWGIDGSNKALDYSAFHMLLSRASIVEFMYSLDDLEEYHDVSIIDRAGICMVDGNIFSDNIHLVGNTAKNIDRTNPSWIDIIERSDEPIIVSFNPDTTDKKPSSHAQGWCVKIMHTLELLALSRLPKEKSGVVIRDGPLLPVAATMKDTLRAMNNVLEWNNKKIISVSKRIQESTLFVEFLTNPQNQKHMEYYFPNQKISRTLMKKLPADYILLPKILKPGQRTPFLEAVPKNRAPITEKNPDLTPVSCYYMRKRAPHSIVRIEFPRLYLNQNREMLDWALSCVAWQHEIGNSVPHVQEFADRQCQLNSEIEILQNMARSELMSKGLETLEVYE